MCIRDSFYISHIDLTSFGSARPFWTLAIEWWIYLFFGYLILVFLNTPKRRFSHLIVLGLLSIAPMYNLIGGRGNGLAVYWIFGVIVYLLSTMDLLSVLKKSLKIGFIFTFLGLAAIRTYMVMDAYDPIFAFLLSVALWITIDIFRYVKFSPRVTRLIRYNASFSYTLYLIHHSVLSFISIHFKFIEDPYVLFGIGFLLANEISILIGRYTEIRLTKKVKMLLYQKIATKTSLTT